MHIKKFTLLSCLIFLSTSSLFAEDLQKYSFLEGCWKSEMNGSVVYESWGNQDGNIMLGSSKSIAGGKLESFEFLSIVSKDGNVLYMPYVNGRNTVSFLSIRATGSEAEFSNPNHDFPKTIRYKRDSDVLQVELLGDGDPVQYQMNATDCPR
jgi:hypothetical protein